MLDTLIISGASKGIGRSIVEKCYNICRTMIVIGSSSKIYNIKTQDCQIISIQRDITDYNQTYLDVLDLFSQDNGQTKNLGIVLAAGQIGENGGIFNLELENWDKIYKCNVLGNLSIIKGCEEVIRDSARTRIVFFSGGGAAFPFPEFSAYSLSKVAVVRAVENMALEFKQINDNASIIALSPGAVETDMLKTVIASGSTIRTKTDISEPTNFVYNFLTDKLPSQKMSGKFFHVRDDVQSVDFEMANPDLFTLRRIQE